MRKKSWIKFISALLAVGAAFLLGGCAAANQNQQQTAGEQKPQLIFADPQWDSVAFNNAVAQYIIENGYGYPTDTTSGSSAITFEGLVSGDIDIYMEVWTDNLQPKYGEDLKSGAIQELGANFSDNAQGLYVPTYLIKGDPARDIEPLAPDLKSVQDLPKYRQLFKDPEDPSKGRIFGSPAGWEVDKILQTKIKSYELDKDYNYFSPGSDTALATSITKAYEEGTPWLGYYWTPTWIMGKYDMTLLQDTPYSEELWNDGYRCAFPSMNITIAVNKHVPQKAPDVVEFLKKYQTNSELLSGALAYMQKNDVKVDRAAIWFLKNNEDIWTKWVPGDIAQNVKATLK